ncbi:disease resistance protein rpp13 [Quercus suber]|uniref:Disease resistance protein rpp13 n=1 Tax=Quercus suber TaxID=58331 RepID=A0AAW0M6B7_QUESU
MADSVVSFLLENLTQLLIQESELLGGVEDQVRILKNELSLPRKRHDKLVKEVVSQIRDVAYEAEDVIDTFIMTETKHRKRSKLRKAFHYFNRASALHKVANEIERIKNVIKEIYENKNKYGIEIAESSGGDAEAEEILHRRRRYVEEDHVYSSNEDGSKDTLTEDLKRFKEMNDKVFKKAWSEFLEGFVRDFYSKNGVKLKDMTDDELKSELLEILKEKRYLLVMDDIWNIEVWNKESSIFLDNSNGSRILITSRIKEVVVHASSLNNCNPIPPYELPFLNEDKSWQLFSEKVVKLSNMDICCLIPKEIENLDLLRYLSISSGARHVIPPDSICNLWNLKTLDMRNSKIECLPKGLWKLQKLTFLLGWANISTYN